MYWQDLRSYGLWTVDGNQYFHCSLFFYAYSCGVACGGNATVSLLIRLFDAYICNIDRSFLFWTSCVWMYGWYASRVLDKGDHKNSMLCIWRICGALMRNSSNVLPLPNVCHRSSHEQNARIPRIQYPSKRFPFVNDIKPHEVWTLNIFAIYSHLKVTSIVCSSIERFSSHLWICFTCEVDSLSGPDTIWLGRWNSNSKCVFHFKYNF